jgi:hypothetical protein
MIWVIRVQEVQLDHKVHKVFLENEVLRVLWEDKEIKVLPGQRVLWDQKVKMEQMELPGQRAKKETREQQVLRVVLE